MKKIILLLTLTLVALQAEDIVHYDTPDTVKPGIEKPNHPNNDIHSVK
ncbi:MAG: hypothetical protein WC665_08080 [Sulfurimonas sp.]|jgi:hypothetical protein